VTNRVPKGLPTFLAVCTTLGVPRGRGELTVYVEHAVWYDAGTKNIQSRFAGMGPER
jgi:hypothetical protein